MKSNIASSMSAGLLLIALIGQVASFKLVKQPVAQPQGVSVQQQEEAIQREQYQQQRQIELLRQQQQQAEYQIQQQQLEAQRLLDSRPLYAPPQQQRQEYSSGVKGAPAPAPAPASDFYDRQQYPLAPTPPATIAYLVVRPQYQGLPPFDRYSGYPSLPYRPQPFAEYPRQTFDAPAGTKGGRQEQVAPPPPPPPPQQPPVEQPALVVPVHGDKHGKLKAMLDKIMSKLSFSSYEVAGEEYVYPPPTKQEGPVAQQPLEQQKIEQFQEEQEPQSQPALVQQQQPIVQQQQQQLPVEQERDQGFDEAVKSPAPQPPKQQIEQTKQEVKEELVQQQQLQEQDFSRQPLAPVKGVQQQVRQPEPVVQQQQQEEAFKSTKRYAPQQQQQQQQYLQQEPLRQDQKGGF